MRKILLGLIFLSLPLFCSGEESIPTEQKISKLLDVMKMDQLITQFYGEVVAQLKPVFPGVKDIMWEDLGQTMETDRFMGLMVALYQKLFSPEEISVIVGVTVSILMRCWLANFFLQHIPAIDLKYLLHRIAHVIYI